jgi:hypothetical protein
VANHPRKLPFFFFWSLLALVNADRVKRKLPSLILDGSTNNKKGWKAFMRSRYRLDRFKEKHPERFNTLTNKVIADLNELEKAVSSSS